MLFGNTLLKHRAKYTRHNCIFIKPSALLWNICNYYDLKELLLPFENAVIIKPKETFLNNTIPSTTFLFLDESHVFHAVNPSSILAKPNSSLAHCFISHSFQWTSNYVVSSIQLYLSLESTNLILVSPLILAKNKFLLLFSN